MYVDMPATLTQARYIAGDWPVELCDTSQLACVSYTHDVQSSLTRALTGL
jgi:hypothetical protein